MKTVEMSRDYDYRPTAQRLTAFKGGKTYEKVPNAAAEAIVAAGAGKIVGESLEEATTTEGTSRRARR